MNFPLFSHVRDHMHSLFQVVKQRRRQWTKPGKHTLVLDGALDLTRSKSELLLENMLQRQQLIVLQQRAKRPALTWRDRTLFVLLASKLPHWREALVLVQPDTVLLCFFLAHLSGHDHSHVAPVQPVVSWPQGRRGSKESDCSAIHDCYLRCENGEGAVATLIAQLVSPSLHCQATQLH